MGVPQIGWFIMENLLKMDDLGVPPFQDSPHAHIILFGYIDIPVKPTQGRWQKFPGERNVITCYKVGVKDKFAYLSWNEASNLLNSFLNSSSHFLTPFQRFSTVFNFLFISSHLSSALLTSSHLLSTPFSTLFTFSQLLSQLFSHLLNSCHLLSSLLTPSHSSQRFSHLLNSPHLLHTSFQLFSPLLNSSQLFSPLGLRLLSHFSTSGPANQA